MDLNEPKGWQSNKLDQPISSDFQNIIYFYSLFSFLNITQ